MTRTAPTIPTLALDRVRIEQACLRRNPQALFFAVLLPIALAVLLGFVDDPDDVVAGERVSRYIVSGAIAFGIITATYVNLAVELTTQRDAGILKRLRTTPLPTSAFVIGHVASLLITTGVLTVAVLLVGRLSYGIGVPATHVPALVVTVVAGTACFAALGLALTVVIPSAAAAAPIANATFIPLALVSGLFGADSTPEGAMDTATAVFPVRALTDALREALFTQSGSAGTSGGDLLVLGAWTVLGTLVAARWFRWMPRH